MYRPWKPIDRVFRPYPSLSWKVENRSITISWTEWLHNKCQFEMVISFEGGIAGVFAIDESTYGTTENLGIPGEEEFDAKDFDSLPWPAWKSERNYRKQLYGILGDVSYRDLYTYYFVGSETILLLDIADSKPQIDIIKF